MGFYVTSSTSNTLCESELVASVFCAKQIDFPHCQWDFGVDVFRHGIHYQCCCLLTDVYKLGKTTGECLSSLQVHRDNVSAMCIIGTRGKHFASGSQDGLVVIWSIEEAGLCVNCGLVSSTFETLGVEVNPMVGICVVGGQCTCVCCDCAHERKCVSIDICIYIHICVCVCVCV